MITDFVTNSKPLQKVLEDEGLSSQLKTKEINISNCNINTDAVQTDRALGLLWDTEKDWLKVKIGTEKRPITRRGILSSIHSIYDPFGLTGPAIIEPKRIFQETCKLKLDWDAELPDGLKEQWSSCHKNLHMLNDYKIDRCIKVFSVISRFELHYFSDGSETAYGSIAFARLISDKDEIFCTPLLAKAKLRHLIIKRIKPSQELNSTRPRYQ